MKAGCIALLLLVYCSFANGQQLRSVFFDPTGTPDDGREYVEIIGTPGGSLLNIWFIQIEGDNPNQGVVRQAIDLSAYSLGTNGLLLIRDAATTIAPGPEPGTHVVVFNFNPDLDNGSGTFLLVTHFTGNVNDDLDTNNDGVLDLFPWTLVNNAIGIQDGNSSDRTYGSSLGGVDIPNIPDPVYSAFVPPNAFLLYNNVYYAIGAGGSGLGPYDINRAYDATGNTDPGGYLTTTILTPGRLATPLPVSFISFHGMNHGTYNKILFNTGIEEDILQFDVLRSYDGRHFEKLGSLWPLGPQSIYSFLDYTVSRYPCYYRIRAVEKSGVYKFSSVMRLNAGNASSVQVFPNPVSDKVHLSLTVKQTGISTVQMVNAKGEMVLKKDFAVQSGTQILGLEVQSLTQGVYYIKVLTPENTTHSFRIVKF